MLPPQDGHFNLPPQDGHFNDITPEVISGIARRLYNELPGANHVPKNESAVQNLPHEASSHVPPEAMQHRFPTGPHSQANTRGPEDGHHLASHRSQLSDHQTPSPVPSAGAPVFSRTTQHPAHSVHYPPGIEHGPAGASFLPESVPPGRQGAPHGPVEASPHSTSTLQQISGSPSLHLSPWALASQHSTTASPSTPQRNDGLSAFVRSLRTTHHGPDVGNDPSDPITNVFRRLSKGHTSTASSRPFDVASIRSDFPVLHQTVHGKPLVWFDNAATTQKPKSVIDAISAFYSHDNSNIHRGAHTLAARATDAFEQARQKVQTFLGASSSNEIVFVRGTTEGINLVAQTWGRKFLQPGDEIVLSTLEHHANIVPWQAIAKEKGAVLRVIPVNDRGEIIMEEYQALLGPRTKLVALTQASNGLGTILPVGEMTQMAKRYNARVLIDGAQSVAHLPVNVQQLDSDFFVFSGHKIFGPTGIGVVYAKKELLEIMPPWQGGGSMIKDVTFEETKFADPPAKFEAGTPNIADAVGLGAALDYVNRLGLPNIAKYEHELLQYGTNCLARIDGLRLIGTAREKVGVLSFVLDGRRTEDVGRMLDQQGIAVRAGHHCAQPSLRRFGLETTVRPSFSIYNTFDEIDRLVDAIRRILRS